MINRKADQDYDELNPINSSENENQIMKERLEFYSK
jgi:hypothetical protein